MPPKIEKAEQVQVDKEVLDEFKRICRVMEKNWTWKIRAILKDWNAKYRSMVYNVIDANYPEVEHGEPGLDGDAMFSDIVGTWIAEETKNLSGVFEAIRTDCSMTAKKKAELKRLLARYGIAMSRTGKMYVAINHPVLAKITGDMSYHVRVRRDLPEYIETKMANVGGRPRRCLVIDANRALGIGQVFNVNKVEGD